MAEVIFRWVLSAAEHNLATFYAIAGLVSESITEVLNCPVHLGYLCNNGEMKLV